MIEPHHINLSSSKYLSMTESWQCEHSIAKYVRLSVLEHVQMALLINGNDRVL